ncbi:hypothetical protein V2I01_05415 [Micromonospora sp. BRA006-A]|nr:hypothetical protein [Micromonospora sp. BRA006-A]
MVVAVAASVLLWVFRDRHPALDFHTAELVKTVAAGDTRPDQMFTATLEERAYLVRSLPDGHLDVTAVEAATGKTVWEKRTDAAAQRWAGIRALPDGLLVLGDATGSDTPACSRCSTRTPAISAGGPTSAATTPCTSGRTRSSGWTAPANAWSGCG